MIACLFVSSFALSYYLCFNSQSGKYSVDVNDNQPRGVNVDKSILVSFSTSYSCSRVFYFMIFYYIFWVDIYCTSVKNCILVNVSCYLVSQFFVRQYIIVKRKQKSSSSLSLLLSYFCFLKILDFLYRKTAGFFLQISKEIGKAWRGRVSSLVSLFVFSLVPDLLSDYSLVLEYAKMRIVLQSIDF